MTSHIPYRAAYTTYTVEPLPLGGDSVLADRFTTDMLRVTEDQFGLFAFYPLSQTRRVEAGTSLSFYRYDLERISTYYVENRKLAEKKEDLPAPSSFGFLSYNMAYVIDNSSFGIASPMRGRRMRYEYSQYFDGLKVYTALADQRAYHFVKPVAFAIRGLYLGRFGDDANTDKLTPLFLGFPTLVRGFDTYSLYEKNEGKITVEEVTGSQIIVSNFEIRLPFTGPRRLAIIKSDYLFTELGLFADAGAAWRHPTKELDPEFARESSLKTVKPVFSTGICLRINLFGMMVIEPYYAIPVTRGISSKGVIGLNFSPGW